MAVGTCRIMMIPCQTRLESLSPGRLDLAHNDGLNSLSSNNNNDNKNPPKNQQLGRFTKFIFTFKHGK